MPRLRSFSPMSWSELALAAWINAGLHSDEELATFLQRYLGVRIPDKRLCSDHQAPFSFVADVFLGRVVDAVVWSCRSGGKSFNEALLTFLDSHFRPKCDTRVLAGSFYQGKQVYGATLNFWDEPGWAQFLLSEPTKSETLSTTDLATRSSLPLSGPSAVPTLND